MLLINNLHGTSCLTFRPIWRPGLKLKLKQKLPPDGDSTVRAGKAHNRNMLSEIKLGAAPAVERDAVDMLLACHQRIRNFTAIAARLGEVEGAGPEEIANAAEAVHRYYTVALPLHEADENQSVYPRLRGVLSQENDAHALELMIEQHGPIDELVARLVPLWNQLRTAPTTLPELQADLRAYAARLLDLWKQHLSLEEEVVFPLIRKSLPNNDLAAIHREMKLRRGVNPD